MTRNQKIFLAILGLYVIFDFILGSLIGVFLWEKTKQTAIILRYYIVLFSSIIIFSQISSYIVGLIGSKKVYIASIILGLFQALFMIIFQKQISSMVIIFGIISGASIGIQSVSYSMVANVITNGYDVTKYLGIKSSTMNIVSVVSVPLIAYLIKLSGSYNFTFVIALFIGLVEIILISKLEYQDSQNNYAPIKNLSYILSFSDIRSFLKTRLFYGVFNGPIWAILGIVTFIFAGDVGFWGVISTIMTVLNIVGSYLYARLRTHNVHRFYSVISTLIFASTTILLATNWNFAYFMIYQLGMVLLNTTFAINYESSIYDLINSNSSLQSLSKEILGMGEIFIGIGRLIPLVALYAINFQLDNYTIIQILFVIIATIPIIISSTQNNANLQG